MSLLLENLREAADVLAAFATPANAEKVEAAAQAMVDSLKAGGRIFSCGNGGSMCDAMHFAEELTGRFRGDRPAIGAVAIADPSHLSCVGNDYGFEHVFSRYLEGMGRKGDVLVAISTSGNSGNVVKAAETANAMGIYVVGLTGKDGGKLAALCGTEIRVPHNGYADRVQEVHIKVIHTLIQRVEELMST